MQLVGPSGSARDVRVVIADDSLFMRHLLRRALEGSPRIEVVGEARDGAEAVKLNAELSPDVLVMDVEMPRLNGLSALSRIMDEKPVPVVMFSSLTSEGAETTIEALALGAVDFLPKPESRISITPIADELVRKVIAAKSARLRWRRNRFTHRRQIQPIEKPVQKIDRGDLKSLIVIGSSTGGPQALDEIIPRLPAGFSGSVVVCQHMPPGFTASMAKRLDGMTAVSVTEAADGEILRSGSVLIAPGGKHLRVSFDGLPTVHLEVGVPVHGVRPSVDVTLTDVASFGPRLMVIILTGMGFDGAKGAKSARAHGARVVCQDEDTSVVWGMPRACIELGGSDEVLPLPKIAQAIIRFAGSFEEGTSCRAM